jgi:branched-chain amino acid transport system ATP-binding protein
VLDVTGLNSFYGQAHILHDVAFSVGSGDVAVLLGRNGAGKSTVMKSLIGMVRPASGVVLFAGQDVARMESFRRAQLGLGYVPEERRVFSDLTVMENLDVGRQRPREGLRPWTPERLFDLFPNLGAMRERQGGRMSGGEQQMLTIARTLMGNPRLLLLDEPSEGLSPLIVEQMAGAIMALRAEGLSILLAEQNLHFAARVASQAVVLESGRVVWAGSIAALEADAEAHARYLAV